MRESREQVEASVKARFSRIALAPSSERVFPVGSSSAKKLGYPASEVDSFPSQVSDSFSGVGNPFSLGDLNPGDTVIDLGCGAGFDCFLAAARVGGNGRVMGVDFTPEMIAKALSNAQLLRATNVEFVASRADRLPAPNRSIDVLLSNGVFNLCIDKPVVAKEMARVLRAGGRLQMADIVLESHVTAAEVAAKGEWSD